jgi:hypothetical protein
MTAVTSPQTYVSADSGVVTPAELADISERHYWEAYEPWELHDEGWPF